MKALLIAGVVFLAGCTSAVTETCITAAEERVRQCEIEENVAACEAAKAQIAECKRLASGDFLDRILDFIRDRLGVILVSTDDAEGRYNRLKDLEAYVLEQ